MFFTFLILDYILCHFQIFKRDFNNEIYLFDGSHLSLYVYENWPRTNLKALFFDFELQRRRNFCSWSTIESFFIFGGETKTEIPPYVYNKGMSRVSTPGGNYFRTLGDLWKFDFQNKTFLYSGSLGNGLKIEHGDMRILSLSTSCSKRSDKVFMFGGRMNRYSHYRKNYRKNEYFNSVWVFDLVENYIQTLHTSEWDFSWKSTSATEEELLSTPHPRYATSTWIENSNFYIFGGIFIHGKRIIEFHDFWGFNLEKNKWNLKSAGESKNYFWNRNEQDFGQDLNLVNIDHGFYSFFYSDKFYVVSLSSFSEISFFNFEKNLWEVKYFDFTYYNPSILFYNENKLLVLVKNGTGYEANFNGLELLVKNINENEIKFSLWFSFIEILKDNLFWIIITLSFFIMWYNKKVFDYLKSLYSKIFINNYIININGNNKKKLNVRTHQKMEKGRTPINFLKNKLFYYRNRIKLIKNKYDGQHIFVYKEKIYKTSGKLQEKYAFEISFRENKIFESTREFEYDTSKMDGLFFTRVCYENSNYPKNLLRYYVFDNKFNDYYLDNDYNYPLSPQIILQVIRSRLGVIKAEFNVESDVGKLQEIEIEKEYSIILRKKASVQYRKVVLKKKNSVEQKDLYFFDIQDNKKIIEMLENQLLYYEKGRENLIKEGKSGNFVSFSKESISFSPNYEDFVDHENSFVTKVGFEGEKMGSDILMLDDLYSIEKKKRIKNRKKTSFPYHVLEGEIVRESQVSPSICFSGNRRVTYTTVLFSDESSKRKKNEERLGIVITAIIDTGAPESHIQKEILEKLSFKDIRDSSFGGETHVGFLKGCGKRILIKEYPSEYELNNPKEYDDRFEHLNIIGSDVLIAAGFEIQGNEAKDKNLIIIKFDAKRTSEHDQKELKYKSFKKYLEEHLKKEVRENYDLKKKYIYNQ